MLRIVSPRSLVLPQGIMIYLLVRIYLLGAFLVSDVKAFATSNSGKSVDVCIDSPVAVVKDKAAELKLDVNGCGGVASLGHCGHLEAKLHCCKTCENAPLSLYTEVCACPWGYCVRLVHSPTELTAPRFARRNM